MSMIGISCTVGCGIATVVTGILALAHPTRQSVIGFICCVIGLLMAYGAFCFNLGYEFRKSEEDGE